MHQQKVQQNLAPPADFIILDAKFRRPTYLLFAVTMFRVQKRELSSTIRITFDYKHDSPIKTHVYVQYAWKKNVRNVARVMQDNDAAAFLGLIDTSCSQTMTGQALSPEIPIRRCQVPTMLGQHIKKSITSVFCTCTANNHSGCR